MAITSHERVGKAMELLRQGLAAFVGRELQAGVKAGTVRMDSVRRRSAAGPVRRHGVADNDCGPDCR